MERLTGVSRAKLRRLKKNGFGFKPHALKGRKAAKTVLFGYTAILDDLLRKGTANSTICLYAEDAGIFGRPLMFHDYLERHRSEDRRALINLFRVLDQDIPQRDRYLDEDLAEFPYVNGGLFADEDIEIPRLGDEVVDLILRSFWEYPEPVDTALRRYALHLHREYPQGHRSVVSK